MSAIASPTNEMAAVAKTPNRFRFIDGLRGFASICVVLAHLSWFINQSSVHELLPDFDRLMKYLTVGASRYFFVITGFVLTHLLIRTAPQWPQFRYLFSRRFLRLSIPYWVSLFLGVGLIWLGNVIFTDRMQTLPTVEQFIAHLLYVQTIFSTEFLNVANWTLAIDLQFFTCYTLGWFLIRWRMNQLNEAQQQRFRWMMIIASVPLALIAVFASLEAQTISNNWFIVFVHIHIMGILCYMSQRNRWASVCLVIIWIVSTTHFYFQERYPRGLPTGSIMALILFLAVHRQALDQWLIGPVWQWLGKISYSLFLTHMLVLPHVCNLGRRWFGDTPAFAACWLTAAFALSFVAAFLFHLVVERPVGAWVRRWKRPPVRPTTAPPTLDLHQPQASDRFVPVNAYSGVLDTKVQKNISPSESASDHSKGKAATDS